MTAKADADAMRERLNAKIAKTPLFKKMIAMFDELSAEEQKRLLLLAVFDLQVTVDQMLTLLAKKET